MKEVMMYDPEIATRTVVEIRGQYQDVQPGQLFKTEEEARKVKAAELRSKVQTKILAETERLIEEILARATKHEDPEEQLNKALDRGLTWRAK